jgi:phage gp36-like protein
MAYCTRDDIEDRYGATNVVDWADLDDDANATSITARITAAIAYASAYIDDRLRRSDLNYRLPISVSGATPYTLKDVCRRIAGYNLSTGRGVFRYDQDGNPLTPLRADYMDALNTLELIAGKKLQMEGVE